jgi:phage tail-like protein
MAKDPHLGLRFWIQLGQVEIAGFRECSPLIIETEVEEYKEGGLNTYYHKLPTRMKYTNITLKRGMDETRSLYDWYVKSASGQIQRQNISIVIYDSEQNRQQQWDLKNAYPCKWTGPDLKAESGAIAVETLEITHEGLLPSTDNQTSSQISSQMGSQISIRVSI